MWSELIQSQIQEITFVLVDAAYNEVPGQVGVAASIRKAGEVAFAAATNAVVEISNGWYRLTLTALETDTLGILTIYIAGTPAYRQQNLAYFVRAPNAGCIEFTYTVTDTGDGLPEADVDVWVTTDAPGLNVVWRGRTDTFGVARDTSNLLPCLDAGSYFFWKSKTNFFAGEWPDIENVS